MILLRKRCKIWKSDRGIVPLPEGTDGVFMDVPMSIRGNPSHRVESWCKVAGAER